MKQPDKMQIVSDTELQKLAFAAQALLAWYWENARILPWRQDKNPYHIWVSEVMLQQTRVEAVIPYYQRFIEQLPDIASLVKAPEGVLLKLWEGLGYYSRVRNMQKAAVAVVNSFGGRIPPDYEQLKSLSGIGEYTAGAIASIAFNIPVPAVDGNVYRVLSRLLSCGADISQTSVKKAFYKIAYSMLPTDSPGDFNQAMMDLGATICLPNAVPKCLICPIKNDCQGYLKGTARSLPYKSPKKSRKIERRTVLIYLHHQSVLVEQRPPKGLLANMWQYPNISGWLEEAQLKDYLESKQLNVVRVTALEESRHIFTHMEWIQKGYLITLDSHLDIPNGHWVHVNEICHTIAMPGAFKTYTNYLNEIFR